MAAENRSLTDADLDAVVARLVDSPVWERIAEHLAQHLTPAAQTEPATEDWLTAKQVATRLNVKPRWVREHKHELGVKPIGAGPKPRLRFDPRRVEAVEWQREQEQAQTGPRRTSRQLSGKKTRAGAPLLPVKGELA